MKKCVFITLMCCLLVIMAGCGTGDKPVVNTDGQDSALATASPKPSEDGPLPGGSTGGAQNQPGAENEQPASEESKQDEQNEEVKIDEDVRFLKWYILLSDNISMQTNVGFTRMRDIGVVFLLSNQYGSPTADGHYEGSSYLTINDDLDTAMIPKVTMAGYSFSSSYSPNCEVNLIEDSLNPGKLTAEFTIVYPESIVADVTASAEGLTVHESGGTEDAEPFKFRMTVDQFMHTDKGGNLVKLYMLDTPGFETIPFCGYLFSSDELTQEEFDEYVDKLNQNIDKEKGSNSQDEQRKTSLESQLENAKKWHDYHQKAAEDYAKQGNSEGAKRNSAAAERERQQIERLEKELEGL